MTVIYVVEILCCGGLSPYIAAIWYEIYDFPSIGMVLLRIILVRFTCKSTLEQLTLLIRSPEGVLKLV